MSWSPKHRGGRVPRKLKKRCPWLGGLWINCTQRDFSFSGWLIGVDHGFGERVGFEFVSRNQMVHP